MSESKKITLSLGPKITSQDLAKPLNGTKRPHSALYDSDNEDEAEGKHEEVTHFDLSAGGAVHTDKKIVPKQLLVIPVSEHSRKRQRGGLPTNDGEAAEAAAAEAKVKAAPIQYGLNVTKSAKGVPEIAPKNKLPIEQVGFKKRTVEEEAMDSLLGKAPTSNAVIPALTDQETFERDYDEAPDAPTEADYDAVPIEEFGAAMLRGMGWKDGEAIGAKRGPKPVVQRVIERRADLLGVGAKPAKALGIELGEWGKHANKHERAINKAYAPVVLKNKKTGELVTEEELKARLKEQEEQAFIIAEEDTKMERRLEYRSSKSSRRDEHDDHSRDDRDKEKWSYRERGHDRTRDRDEGRHKSSRRERSTSVGSRRRYKDDDSEDERRERKKKDKGPRHRDRSSSPKTRHRSNYDKHSRRDTKSREEPRSHHKERFDKDRRR
ncbi:hypothetical protein FKW77_007538 [Venturia effusa]|uniref:Pre-mRNA-splicing factor n=1 Tax=Venturia effusa TaxID=50376 RepID=A0A517LB64_9PEZI|nr:hypothetical protein FKW77_007538 [Venturia effusa]